MGGQVGRDPRAVALRVLTVALSRHELTRYVRCHRCHRGDAPATTTLEDSAPFL